jgi:hypothetical protein
MKEPIGRKIVCYNSLLHSLLGPALDVVLAFIQLQGELLT